MCIPQVERYMGSMKLLDARYEGGPARPSQKKVEFSHSSISRCPSSDSGI